MRQSLAPQRDREGTLVHVVETLLDRGLVLNADIMVSVAGVELLGIRVRAALASFETAARYGLEFPAGTDTQTAAWREAMGNRETCLGCGKRVPAQELLERSCPWCGWRSARALAAEESGERAHPNQRSAERIAAVQRTQDRAEIAAAGRSGERAGAAGQPGHEIARHG